MVPVVYLVVSRGTCRQSRQVKMFVTSRMTIRMMTRMMCPMMAFVAVMIIFFEFEIRWDESAR